MKTKFSIIIIIIIVCFLVGCGQSKRAADLTGEDKVHLAEKLIQGTWEYKDQDDNSVQRITFDDGHCEYIYIKPDGTKDAPTRGIYMINDDGMTISLNGNEAFCMYDIKDDKTMTFSFVPDGGANKGVPEEYQKVD